MSDKIRTPLTPAGFKDAPEAIPAMGRTYRQVIALMTSSGQSLASISPRPPHCDRGRYWADIDVPIWRSAADPWPRYYFSLENAKEEVAAYLVAKQVNVQGTTWKDCDSAGLSRGDLSAGGVTVLRAALSKLPDDRAEPAPLCKRLSDVKDMLLGLAASTDVLETDRSIFQRWSTKLDMCSVLSALVDSARRVKRI